MSIRKACQTFAAAELAKEKKAELVIGDPDFKLLGKEITIHWLK